jgi:hypothetical protein
MNMNRHKATILCFALAWSLASAEEPVSIHISDAGVEIGGVIYRTKAVLIEAFRKLNPSAVRFVPAKGASYQTVSDALTAFQESGINAQTGFVGVASSEKQHVP